MKVQVLSDEVRVMGDYEYRDRIVVTDVAAPRANSTTGIGFIVRDDNILLVKNRKYGWTVPGGHIEADETPDEAMCREVWEEACVHVGRRQLLGYNELRLLTDPVPDGYRYPIPSYQCFFAGVADDIGDFTPNDEVAAVGFFTSSDDVYAEWVAREGTEMQKLHELAIALTEGPR